LKSTKHAYSCTVCLPQFVAVNRDSVLRNFFSEAFVGYKGGAISGIDSIILE